MRLLRPSLSVILIALAASSATACGGGSDFIVGATTSVHDTGLLDVLTNAFREESGYDVAAITPIVAGSGQILELARRGEVDAVITHSPQGEAKFIVDGDGIDRRPFMRNLFLIVGPPDDPAKAAAAGSSAEALKLIADAASTFVSRGDQSGTHVRELERWEEAGIDPSGESWYLESGAGQGQSLLVASDKGAYTLVDSATFAVFEDRLDLQRYVDDDLPNQYSVIRVNPNTHDVNEEAALAFSEFLVSPTAQRVIADFGREEYGEPLFVPVSSFSDSESAATPAP